MTGSFIRGHDSIGGEGPGTGSGRAVGTHAQGEAPRGVDEQLWERKKVKNKVDKILVSGRVEGEVPGTLDR